MPSAESAWGISAFCNVGAHPRCRLDDCACSCHPPGIIQGSASRADLRGDVQPVTRQLVDDVVRDLVSRYPGTVQAVNLPTPDSALVRLHRGDSTWLISIARLEVTE